jgi:hypothetical protein
MDDVPAGEAARLAQGQGGPVAVGAGRAPAWARRFVAAYLALFLVCGLFGLEAWPLTGWRLFADARPARQAGWQADTVDRAGRETPVPFRDLPAGYQGNVQVLKGFAGLSPARRAAVCHAWAGAVRARGGEVAAVRVYRTETDVSRRVGERGAPPRRTLFWTCPAGSADGPG